MHLWLQRLRRRICCHHRHLQELLDETDARACLNFQRGGLVGRQLWDEAAKELNERALEYFLEAQGRVVGQDVREEQRLVEWWKGRLRKNTQRRVRFQSQILDRLRVKHAME